MINEKETIRLSKFISLVLRHKPEEIHLVLDPNGWADTYELISKMNKKGFAITMSILEQVVATNNKSRFTFNEDKSKIRASQGHSVDVDLELAPVAPPEYLYHGTAERYVNSILATGIDRRERQHVHLSGDLSTALQVGKRHGVPKIFLVATGQMNKDGYSFYVSENKVWLTEHVPAKYLRLLDN